LLSVSIGSIENLQIPLKFARPGKERQDSVFNGLQVSGKSLVSIAPAAPVHKYRIDLMYIACLQEIDGDSELLCVHDSARPLVSSEDVKKVTPVVHDAA